MPFSLLNFNLQKYVHPVFPTPGIRSTQIRITLVAFVSMDLEGLFNVEIMFDHEADVTFNAATNIFEESAEAVAIREASSLTLPGFDDLVHSLHDMESVNLFTYCFLACSSF